MFQIVGAYDFYMIKSFYVWNIDYFVVLERSYRLRYMRESDFDDERLIQTSILSYYCHHY